MNPAYNLYMWHTGFYEGQKHLHQDFMKVRNFAPAFYEGLKESASGLYEGPKNASGLYEGLSNLHQDLYEGLNNFHQDFMKV